MIRLTLTILFMFFLPGYTLINAVFPAKGEFDEGLDMLYRIAFSIGISGAIFVSIGFILGNIPINGGLFVASNLWISLVSLTFLFFIVGWYRGRYQFLAIISSKLSRDRPDVTEHKNEGKDKVRRLQELAKRRGALKERIKFSDGEKKQELEEELKKIEEKLKKAEAEREKDF